jgi:hypothetical protein
MYIGGIDLLCAATAWLPVSVFALFAWPRDPSISAQGRARDFAFGLWAAAGDHREAEARQTKSGHTHWRSAARHLRDFPLRLAAFLCFLRCEGAAKSLISFTPFIPKQATNQGVVGSIPASRTIFMVLNQQLRGASL